MTSNTTVELWTLYAFGFLVTVLRTYARITAVGIRELRADDYLIWIAIVRGLLSVGSHHTNTVRSSSTPRRLRWGIM